MSKEVIIKTQKQLDKLKPDFEGTIYIEGGEQYSPLELSIAFEDARVIVRGEAWVRLRESSHAELWESSHAELRESSHAVLRESSHAVLWESSHAELRESSHAELRGSSHAVLWESSHAELRGSSHAELRESSHAELWGSSHAVLWESSHAVLWESSHAVLWESTVAKLFGEAIVTARSAKEIVCAGYNVISVRKSDQKKINIVVNKNSYLKITPDFDPIFEHYAKLYPVEVKRKKAVLYKAVHKDGDTYHSDYDRSFKYEIGKKIEIKCDPSQESSCRQGLHVSHKSWARDFGASWNDLAILECEVPVDKIVVSKDCDGKVRTSQLKVLREVPREEWYA